MRRAALPGSLAVALVALAALGCSKKEPAPITARWTDDFERAQVGDDYHATSNAYELVNGALSAQGAYNHPLWLKKKLPRDVVVELDVWSNTPDGDIKVELFGDGESHATSKGAYTATGYVFVFGGWNNSKSILARRDEHGVVGTDLVERTSPKVEPERRYHWKIVRRGGQVDWFIDDMQTPFLSFTDPEPLAGAGHEYFGVNNWQSDSWFDDLVITPAE